MNLDEYKKAMQEIHVDTDKVKFKFYEKLQDKSKGNMVLKSTNFKKPLLICLTSLILAFILTTFSLLNNGKVSDFEITVYAYNMEEELALTDIPVGISTTNRFNSGCTMGDTYASIMFDVSFRCEGENIKRITYKLSDQPISLHNYFMPETVAWFAENITYEKNSVTDADEDKNIYSAYGFDNNIWHGSIMLGNVYTVDYENQNDKNYAIEIRMDKVAEGIFEMRDVTITIIIEFDDGTITEKHILVQPKTVDWTPKTLVPETFDPKTFDPETFLTRHSIEMILID